MSRSLTIVKDTMIIILVTVVLLVLIEGALRLIWPRDSFRAEKISYRYDSILLVSIRPSIERTYLRDRIDGGTEIRWNINAEGFRHGPMRKGVRRIMVYGDSNVQGVFSEDDKTFCARLESCLMDSCTIEAEVINAGTVGYGPDQCLLKFQREIPIFHPDDAVFVIFGHNDYGDLIRNRLFELDQDSNLRMTTHVRELDPLMRKPGIFQGLRIADMIMQIRGRLGLDKPPGKAEIEEMTISQYQDLCRVQFDNYLLRGPNIYSHFFDNYDIDVAVSPKSPSARTKIKLMKEVMKEIAMVAEANNVRLWFVVLPSAIDITRNRSISCETLQRFPDYEPDNLTCPVVMYGTEMKVPTLDLYRIYQPEDHSTLYFSGEFNDHWTDLGQDLAAIMTARMICDLK